LYTARARLAPIIADLGARLSPHGWLRSGGAVGGSGGHSNSGNSSVRPCTLNQVDP
jgi:hypothetical protein